MCAYTLGDRHLGMRSLQKNKTPTQLFLSIFLKSCSACLCSNG
ncbi:MAG: hypothetical protein SAK29_02405 [Scytonema sp. PMC 1069.18]|nr:hypothetical protein [Scytonema sp. PMC 1069.18]MEC4884855.1 hypothetical protein [Scytonema sp. PMC 1070.18]